MSGEGMTINFEEEIEHFKPSLEVEEVGEAIVKSLMYSIIPFPSFEPMPPRHGAGYLIYLYCNIIIAATAQQGRKMIIFHNQIIKLNRYVLEFLRNFQCREEIH